MGIRDRLKRLERATEGNFQTFVCPDCGETFKDAGDVALRVIVAGWQDEVGQEREPDTVVDSILTHPCEGLADAVFESFPGLRHA